MVGAVLVGLLWHPGPAAAEVRTLWISDDVTETVYRVTLDGALVESVKSLARVHSSIAVDPSNGTLWGAAEAENLVPGGVANSRRDGSLLTSISETAFGGDDTEGVAVDFFDYTLWVVDDSDRGQIPHVYHVARDGTLRGSFPSIQFDLNALSPQSIASDPIDGTLWITDNHSASIYNITTNGALLTALSTRVFDPALGNPQGISVDPSNHSLWVSGRDTHRIYNVTRSGELLSSFSSTTYDPQSRNPTGVALDTVPIGDMGDAARFAVLGLDGVKLLLRNGRSGVEGDVGVGPRGQQVLASGVITGSYISDLTARAPRLRRAILQGGTATQDLSAAVASARAASVAAAALPSTTRLGTLKRSQVVVADRRLSIIAVQSIDLADGATLTLDGPPGGQIIVNVSGGLRVRRRAAIKLAPGLIPRWVIINVVGRGAPVVLDGGSRVAGTVLAPDRRAILRGRDTSITGALIAGRRVGLTGGARVIFSK